MADFALLSNVLKFNDALSTLQGASEQMMLVYGPPGMGKTTTAVHSYVHHNGVLLRCITGLTQKSLLQMLLRELGQSPKATTNAEMLLQSIDLLAQNPRPLFIDEADRLFESKRLFESVRDLHDGAKVPVVMLGASSAAGFVGVDQHLRRYPQMADRIAHWVQFTPATKEDFVALQNLYAPKVELSPELQARILQESGGNIRRIRVGLKNCVFLARRKKVTALTERDFGKAEIVQIGHLKALPKAQ
ncbi:AAA family ATPase [Vacuolonema iberomarrocanum]|uniref:AAA family ATPase n=1 Tax=Vacuolonema iberomarrocanum TaxID=3454632 RepID=UPI001A0B0B12|nr:ATP-binding protein [filamentous cyanobacterium LEGE 07170]